jgi:hypothetical protein
LSRRTPVAVLAQYEGRRAITNKQRLCHLNPATSA